MAISIYPSKILEEPGLLAFYRFETNSTDWSGNGNGGSSANALFSQPPALLDESYSAYFNGVSAYVNLQNRFTFPNRDPFTIEFWAYPVEARASGYQALVSKEDLSPSPDAGWSVHIDNANKRWGFTRYDTSTYRWATSPSNSVTLYQWTHIAATYDGSYIRLYVDGSLASTQAAGFTAKTSTYPVNVGREYERSYFNGNIDELAIYSRALSASEIADHYASRAIYYTQAFLSISDGGAILSAQTLEDKPTISAQDGNTVTALTNVYVDGSATLSRGYELSSDALAKLVVLLSRADEAGLLTTNREYSSFGRSIASDVGFVFFTEEQSTITENPPVLNAQYAEEITLRSEAIHRVAARFASDSFSVLYRHVGIFSSDDVTATAATLGQFILGQDTLVDEMFAIDDITDFVVLNNARVPIAVGTAITDWNEPTIVVTATRNVYTRQNLLQGFGIDTATQG